MIYERTEYTQKKAKKRWLKMKEKSSQQFFFSSPSVCWQRRAKKNLFFIHSLKLEEARCGESKKKIITEVGKLFPSNEIQHTKKANRENQIKCKNGTRIVNHNVI